MDFENGGAYSFIFLQVKDKKMRSEFVLLYNNKNEI